MDVGLIGLGKMGAGITRSLLRAGHRVTVYNRSEEKAEALRADGATVAPTIGDTCRSGIVLTMLFDDAAFETTVFGAGGILSELPKGGVHVALSTISVTLSDRLEAAHRNAGQEFVAAPVFGRPDAAEAARLAVVAAGPAHVIERCRPLFEAMGPKLFVSGTKPSSANAVKLAGNFLIASVLESLAEALTFARKSGVDPAALLDFLTSTLFNAPVYKTYGALIVEGNYDQAGGTVKLGLKDVGMVLRAAEDLRVPMPFASILRDRLLTAAARGNDDRDWSVLGRLAAEDAGLVETAKS